ncbi:hypothetical protein Ddc_12456 [Ditylenchus destructor]|nr:hypothetical protein Ddc_12456 [Ditylenchus destructor]
MVVSFALYILLFGVFLNVRYCDGIDERSRPMRPNETCDIVGASIMATPSKQGPPIVCVTPGTTRAVVDCAKCAMHNHETKLPSGCSSYFEKCKEYGECKPGADVCMFAVCFFQLLRNHNVSVQGGTSRVNDEECVIPEDACDQIYAVNKCGKIGTNKAMQYLKFLCDEKARPCSHIPPTTVAPTTTTKVPRTTTTTLTVMSSEMSPSTDPSNNTSTCPVCDCLSSGNPKSHINLALVMISSTIYLICGFAHFFH